MRNTGIDGKSTLHRAFDCSCLLRIRGDLLWIQTSFLNVIMFVVIDDIQTILVFFAMERYDDDEDGNDW